MPAIRSSSYRFLPLLMMALLSGAVSTGCSKTKTSQDYLADAQGYHAKGDDKSAVIQLKNALQKDASNGDARYLLGTIYSNNGNLAAAEDELHKALSSAREKDKVQNALGQIYLQRGEFQKIIDEMKPVPAMKGEELAVLLVLRGDAYLGLNKQDDAGTSYAGALMAVPGFADAVLGQARLAAAGNKPDETMKLIDQVIAAKSDNVKAWLMKGDMLRAKADPEGAAKAYAQVLKIDGNNIAAHVNLASMALDAGKMDEAQKEIDALAKIQPNNLMGRYLQAMLHFREKKFAAARDDLEQVLKGAPDHMPSLLLMGAVSFELGSFEVAQKDLGRFVDAFPNNAYARKLLAQTLLKMKQPDGALKALGPMLNDAHADLQTDAIAADAYMQAGQYAKAVQYLEKAVAANPKNSDLRMQLGLARLAGGQTDGAIADLEAAARLDPAKLEAENALALTYLGKKDYDHALSTIQTMIMKDPKNPAYFNLQGAAYVGKNDIPGARKSFESAMTTSPGYVPAALNLGQLDLKDNPEAARKRFEGVLSIDKSNVQAMLYLSAIAKNAGNDKEFVDWLEKATKANPAALQPWNMLTDYYLQQKNQKEAVAHAEAAANANPKSPEALDLLGSTQLAIGKMDDAVATYKKLLELVPRSPLANYRLGVALSAGKDVDAAANSFARALELKPDYVEAADALVGTDIRAGKYAAALKVASDFQQRFPKAPEGLLLEGDVAMAQKEFEKASSAYGKAQAVGKTTVGAIKLHGALTLAGKVKQADDGLLQWLHVHPKDVMARNYMGDMLLREGNLKGAEEQYQAVLQVQPDNLAALNNLAVLYQKTNDPKAEEMARRAYKLAPEAPEIMDTLGWILAGKGDVKEGLDLLQKAVTLAPNAPDIHYHYAAALVKAGDKAKAKDELTKLVSSGKNFPQLQEAKALLGTL